MPESLLDRPTVYGTRAKLGLIVPPTNTANEAEWSQLVPAGVTIHSARMPLHADTTSDTGRKALHDDIEHYSAQLAMAGVDVIVYGCTAGSMVSPVSSLPDFVTAKTNTAAVTTAQAIVQALSALQVKKLAVATPYHDTLNSHERSFLTENGFTVVSLKGLGYGQNGPSEFRNIARVNHDAVHALAHEVDHPDADALLISCTDLATLSVIETLEHELNKPVISSNSATLWAALRTVSINEPITGAGKLLSNSY